MKEFRVKNSFELKEQTWVLHVRVCVRN